MFVVDLMSVSRYLMIDDDRPFALSTPRYTNPRPSVVEGMISHNISRSYTFLLQMCGYMHTSFECSWRNHEARHA